MSDYIQFVTARPGKFDGKTYEAGKPFPYDPDNPQHVIMYEQGLLKAVKVTQARRKKAK